MPGRAVAELDQLGVALAGDHEQRRRARDDEEPRRDRHADRDTARDRAQHEARRDAAEVEHRLVLQPQPVGHRDAPGTPPTTTSSQPPLSGADDGRARATIRTTAVTAACAVEISPGRDRAVPLRRMAAVGLDVDARR